MEGDDPVNWSQTEGAEFAKEVIGEAKAPIEKRPLFRPASAALEFPVEALGPLADVARAIQQRTQAPIAIAAQSVLAAATLAVQAQRDVIIPGSGRRPLTGNFVSIADSGERKSSVDRLALAAVYEVERDWRQKWDGERLLHCNAKEAWDASREYAKKAAKGDAIALNAAFNRIGPPPSPPPHPMLLIADPTPEGLIMHLADGRPFAGVFTAEGGLIMGGAAFSQDSKMRTAALFNALWDGDAIRRKRIGTGTTFLPGRRCSAHLMMQPIIAAELLGNSLFDGIGLTARMLMVWPDSTAGRRPFSEAPASSSIVLEAYNQRLRELLTRPPIIDQNTENVLNPPPMTMSADAARSWISFYDSCETSVLPNAPLFAIKAFAGKLAEHAARLAGVLTVYNDPNAMEVHLAAMQCGITLATHYANEMLRLQSGVSISGEARLAQRLLSWWQEQQEPIIYLSKVYQYGPSELREAKLARQTIKFIVEHGWACRLKPGTIIDGLPRREAWVLT